MKNQLFENAKIQFWVSLFKITVINTKKVLIRRKVALFCDHETLLNHLAHSLEEEAKIDTQIDFIDRCISWADSVIELINLIQEHFGQGDFTQAYIELLEFISESKLKEDKSENIFFLNSLKHLERNLENILVLNYAQA